MKRQRKTVLLLLFLLLISQQRSANAGIFDDLVGNPNQIIRDILKSPDPFKKKDEDIDPASIGEKKVYEDIDVNDVTKGVSVLQSLLKGKFNDLFSWLEEILGTGEIDPVKNSTVLGEKNRSEENENIPSEPSASSSNGKTVDEVVLQNPITPRAIAENQARIDANLSVVPRQMSQIVLGEQGQANLIEQEELSVQSLETTTAAVEGLISTGETSAASASFSEVLAKESQGLANQAQGRKASQDVLKDTAAITAKNSFSLSAIADQNVDQTVALGQLGRQLNAINQQSAITNQKMATIQLLSASQNEQMGQLLSIDLHQQQQDQAEKIQRYQSAASSNSGFWLPGIGEFE